MKTTLRARLIYVHDPMCSWCWGFEPVRQQLFRIVSERIEIKTLLGGLAPDSDEPMPISMQLMLKSTWQKIQKTIPGTQFNYDFWDDCKPRRSTYPANRAVLAARMQGLAFEQRMTLRIQQAYYLEAKNPSDNNVLSKLAVDIGLDVLQFDTDICSTVVERELNQEISLTRSIGLNSFPSMALETSAGIRRLHIDYTNTKNNIEQIFA